MFTLPPAKLMLHICEITWPMTLEAINSLLQMQAQNPQMMQGEEKALLGRLVWLSCLSHVPSANEHSECVCSVLSYYWSVLYVLNLILQHVCFLTHCLLCLLFFNFEESRLSLAKYMTQCNAMFYD